MAAARTSSRPAEITPAQRRDEIIYILAAGLVRLIRAGQAPGGAVPVHAGRGHWPFACRTDHRAAER